MEHLQTLNREIFNQVRIKGLPKKLDNKRRAPFALILEAYFSIGSIGKITLNVVPLPGTVSTNILPP